MKTTAALKTSVKSFRSEMAFEVLWEIHNELEAENAVSAKGNKLFHANVNFNMHMARQMRIPTYRFTAGDWNRLVFYAAGEIAQDPDTGRYSNPDVVSNRYGSALMFVLLTISNTFGTAYGHRLLFGYCKNFTSANPLNSIVEESVAKMLFGSNSEALSSIVLRKLLEPSQVIVAIKQMLKGSIRNRIRKFPSSGPEVNPRDFMILDSNAEVLTDESIISRKQRSYTPEDRMQLEHLMMLIDNAAELLDPKEKELIALMCSDEGRAIGKGKHSFESHAMAVAHLLDLQEYQTRYTAQKIVKKIRCSLGARFTTKSHTYKDFFHRSQRSRAFRGLIDASKASWSGKKPAAVVDVTRRRNVMISYLITPDDVELLLDAANDELINFASLKEPEITN